MLYKDTNSTWNSMIKSKKAEKAPYQSCRYVKNEKDINTTTNAKNNGSERG